MELIDLVNSFINFLSQTTFLKWLTFLLRSQTDSHSPALLNLFILSDASICFTMAFPTLGNFDHVVVSVSIDFPSKSQQDSLFHCIAYGYSHADWDGLLDHLRDVPWEDIFKISASAGLQIIFQNLSDIMFGRHEILSDIYENLSDINFYKNFIKSL